MLTVAVRFRPESYLYSDLDIDDDTKSNDGDIPSSIEVFEEPKNYIRINHEFNLYFDTVLGSNSFQSDVFSQIIRCKANDFLNGENCCILTYGAKSSGKSYTMFGKLSDKNAVSHLGILPRTISYVIEKLHSYYHSKSRRRSSSSSHDNIDWNLFISFGTAYNEKISDLINTDNTKHIHLKRNKKTSEYYLKNLTQIKIKKISSFLKHMHLAEEHRKKYHSSESGASHMFAVIKLNVYKLTPHIHNTHGASVERTKLSSTVLNFIDCAGYPSIDLTANPKHVQNSDEDGMQDREDSEQLNFSFIQLNALMTRIAKKNELHIDMRESVLTKLLYPIRQNTSKADEYPSDSNGKLLVLINCTRNRSLAAETMATLRFGNLPTIDPFILGMMEKQRHKMKKLELKSKEYKTKYRDLKKVKQYSKTGTKHMDPAQEDINVDEWKHIIAGLERENGDLTRNVMEIENKYELLQSEYELMKLDYASNKKELNTQKNHNFWLMEDYNELKLKIGSAHAHATCSSIHDDEDKVSQLLKEMRVLREEKAEHDMKVKRYEMELSECENELTLTVEKHEKELNELMIGIKERDDEIQELHRELRAKEEENVNQNKMMKTDREMYEKYIKELEEARHNDTQRTNEYKEDGERMHNNNNNSDEIRALKMEIIKYKTDISSSVLVEKLRNKKRKLEEKVINLRTDKAKQIVKHNQEMHVQEERMNAVQQRMHNMNAIRKWRKLVHKRQLIAASKNMQRANKKMKENYTQNSEFRDQMFLLRKMADKKLQSLNNYEQIAIETTTDFERDMIGLLPTNLKRIHTVMDRLTNKLMIKNGEIHELRRKLKEEAMTTTRASVTTTHRHSSSSSNSKVRELDDNIYSPSVEQHTNLLDGGGDMLPSETTNIINAYSSNNNNNDDEEEIDREEEEPSLHKQQAPPPQNETPAIDIAEEENYLNKQYSIATSMDHEANNSYNDKSNEYRLKEKQLRLLKESALSVAFHLDNANNTRIKLNIAMSPYDVYREMCGDSRSDSHKNLSLIIQHNICPDFERIVIPSNCMNMSFWQLCVEFGIFNLLHFNICCDQNAQRYLNDDIVYSPKIKYKYKNRKRKDSKRGSGLWNMFAKK